MTNTIDWNDVKANNKSVKATLAIVKLQEKNGTNGPYVSGQYTDGSTIIQANTFNSLKELNDQGIKEGCIINVTVSSVTKYDRQYFNLSGFELAQGADCERFAVKADIDPETAFRELTDIVYSHKSSPCETGITDVTLGLLEENKEEFITSSAACANHHIGIGGLLQHSLRMTRVAEKIASEYTDLNDELLICGTALHDIGKIRSMQTNELGIAKMTDIGVLEEHALAGVLMVNDYINKHNIVMPCESKMVLEHMIASHHGKREYGAIQVPAIPEAMVLNYLDLIDSRMYMFMHALEDVEANSVSGYQKNLETSVYNYRLCEKCYE